MHHGFWLGFLQFGTISVLLSFVRLWSRSSSGEELSEDGENLLKLPRRTIGILALGAVLFVPSFMWTSLGGIFSDNVAMKVWACSLSGTFAAGSLYYCFDYFRNQHVLSEEGILSRRVIGRPAVFLRWQDVERLIYEPKRESIKLVSGDGTTTRISWIKQLLGMSRFAQLVLVYVPNRAVSLEARSFLESIAH